MRITQYVMAGAMLVAALSSQAQSITLPQPSQAASVSQSLGAVKISVDYHSPAVKERRGKIWGGLVPYGMQPTLGYGTCKQCPWRGGANENTVFETSHDIKVEGQTLKAGRYGLHFVPDPNEWTVIFSNNSTSWGSFFYEPSEDALRVKAKPSTAPYHEYLTYEFTERTADKGTLALEWEELALPIHIAVDNPQQLVIDNLRRELRGAASEDWHNWYAAARYALANKLAPQDALTWAQTAVSGTFVGEESFATLMTLAEAQDANNLAAEAAKTRQRALDNPKASVLDVHRYARQLLDAGKKDEAVRVFELNAKRHPNEWPVNVGLARAYKAVGRSKDALKYAKLALPQAPDDVNRNAIAGIIKELESGK